MSQSNQNRKPAESAQYYFVGFITPDGQTIPLLLTPNEFARAARRAQRNPEDIWTDFVVVQSHKPDTKDQA